MVTFAIRRTLGLIAVLFVLSVLVFLIFFSTPGVDPARQMAGRNPNPETIANIRHEFGLDRSKPVQYVLMMKHMFWSHDLISYGSHTKVIPQILSAAPVTFSLVFGAAVIWVVFSVLTGVAAAVLRGTVLDPILMVLALIGISVPVFWLGEVANLLTQSRLHGTFLFSWVPPLGYTPLTQNPFEWFKHLIIPWIVLSVLYVGFYARVLLKHVLRNSLIPIVTLFGLDFAAVLGGGAILTESVFDLHGVGQYAAQSTLSLDLPPIIGVTIYATFFIVLFNTLVDLLYAYLDPRIRPT